MDMTYRLPDGYTEEDLQNPAYAGPLAQAAAPMEEQCRQLLAKIGDASFDGRIELDCTDNGACTLLDDFFETLALYEEGRVPFAAADELVRLTGALLEAEMTRYPNLAEDIHAMRQTFKISCTHWRRRLAVPRLEPEEYRARLREDCRQIVKAICAFNRKLFKPEGIPAPRPARGKAKTSGEKGGSHSRMRRYADKVERGVLEFVESPEFDTDREYAGRPCRDVRRAARAWAQLKHPRGYPQTVDDFLRVYKNATERRRRAKK